MRSLSQRHFEANVEEETLKNVVPHSVATVLASNVFPVLGRSSNSLKFKKETNMLKNALWSEKFQDAVKDRTNKEKLRESYTQQKLWYQDIRLEEKWHFFHSFVS